MAVSLNKITLLPVLSLFGSVSTLLCCALPVLLVTLGMGAALAGLVSVMPWLSVLSEHKVFIFLLAGVLLIAAVYLQWRSGVTACPTDPDMRRSCNRLKKFSWLVLIISIAIYLVGFFFAFLAADIFYS